MEKKPKRPRDANQLAKMIVDISTGNAPAESPAPQKNPAAVALGKLGGVKGGPARAAKAIGVEAEGHREECGGKVVAEEGLVPREGLEPSRLAAAACTGTLASVAEKPPRLPFRHRGLVNYWHCATAKSRTRVPRKAGHED